VPSVTAPRQDGQKPAQFEFEQRGLQRRTVHFGARSQNFKGGRRMTQRGQQPVARAGKRDLWRLGRVGFVE
jgi:hypothetical protein